MPKPIKLTCYADSTDAMHVVGASIGAERVVHLDTVTQYAASLGDENSDSRVAFYLDESRARELFNWLGVWLHTH